jgi:5'(3')-deoxyribonucleotidase
MTQPKKKIAIDLDDTLVPTIDMLIKEMLKDRRFPAFRGYHSITDFSYEEEIILYQYMRAKINEQDIINFEPIVGSKQAITKLAKKYDLYVVTARTKDVKKHTRKWIKYHFPGIFKKIIFGHSIEDVKYKKTKGQICKENNISLLIDDNKKYILDVHKQNIKTIVFDYKGKYAWSKAKYPKSIPIANSWKEVLEKIKKLKI